MCGNIFQECRSRQENNILTSSQTNAKEDESVHGVDSLQSTLETLQVAKIKAIIEHIHYSQIVKLWYVY